MTRGAARTMAGFMGGYPWSIFLALAASLAILGLLTALLSAVG